MGLIHHGIPEELASLLQERFGIKFFVETGTYSGSTACWASKRFAKVWTIEACESLYLEVTNKYAREPNINFILGNSREKLVDIVSDLDRPALFWFDAHWSAGGTFGEKDECPLLDELRCVNQSDVGHFLFIDDARYFLAPPPPPHQPDQWPDMVEVLNKLMEKERYVAVIDDVIVALPVSAKATVIEYCRSRYSAQQTDKRREGKSTQIAAFQGASKSLKRLLRRFLQRV